MEHAPTAARMVPVSSPEGVLTGESFVQMKLQELFQAEAAQAAPEQIALLRSQVDYASRALGLTKDGPAAGLGRPAFDEAGKLIRVLNGGPAKTTAKH